MSAALVPIAVGFATAALAILVILNLTLARGARRADGAEGQDAKPSEAETAPTESAQIERQELGPESELELPSFQDLDQLRRLPGVRGVALWGPHGAVLRAEGELLETILPEAVKVLETLRHVGGAVGSGPWMSFKVEGLTGSIYGAKMHGVSLVVVTDPSAEANQIERHVYQATLHAPGQLAEDRPQVQDAAEADQEADEETSS